MVQGDTCMPTVHNGHSGQSPPRSDAVTGGMAVERDWWDRAAIGEGGPALVQITAAKVVCADCPVVAQCLAFSLVALPEGVAGGLTATERRELRAHRAAGPPAPGSAVGAPRLPGGVDRHVVAQLVGGERVSGASRLELAQAAAELARAGHGCRWIATRLGVGDRQVYRWLARHRADKPMVAQADRRRAGTAVAS
jgi:hypothetical protein